MAFQYHKAGELLYLTSGKIEKQQGLRHLFTARHGGVSGGSLKSLNLGTGRPDLKENILENYRRACAAADIPHESCVLAKQTHTTNIRIVCAADRGKGLTVQSDIADTDGLITAEKNLPLVIFYADCVPVLLYAPQQQVVAALHAGWRGTVGGIVKQGVRLMQQRFGVSPGEIFAAIGPSIGQCHFETGLEVAEEFEKAGLQSCVLYRKDKAFIDLWRANAGLLKASGVPERQIDIAEICTVCEKDDFFSHRGCGPDTGRMALIACLK